MALSSNLIILIIVLLAAGCSIIGYSIFRMFHNGKSTNADGTVGSMSDDMTPTNEQKQYMKKLRDRYRGDIESQEVGMYRYEAPPKKRFWQSVETFESYESGEDMYDYDMRSPKGRFKEGESRAGSSDWL